MRERERAKVFLCRDRTWTLQYHSWLVTVEFAWVNGILCLCPDSSTRAKQQLLSRASNTWTILIGMLISCHLHILTQNRFTWDLEEQLQNRHAPPLPLQATLQAFPISEYYTMRKLNQTWGSKSIILYQCWWCFRVSCHRHFTKHITKHIANINYEETV